MSGFVVLHLVDRSVGRGAGVFTAFAASVVGTRLLGRAGCPTASARG